MCNEIKLSIICPTYNHEKYIIHALNSMLSQKTKYTIEILIGEDKSPDNSKEILQEYEKKYPGRLQVFYREKNLGGQRNVKDLFKRAKGEYIQILELDDYWLDDFKIGKQIAFLDLHPEFVACAHNSIIVDENEILMNEKYFEGDVPDVINLQCFLDNGFVFHTSSLMFRNYFKKDINYLNYYSEKTIVGDLVNVSILLLQGNIYYMHDTMSAYRLVIKGDGTNAQSIARQDRKKTIFSSFEQLLQLETLFKGQIKYSKRKAQLIAAYILAVKSKDIKLKMGELFYLYKNTDPKGHKEFFSMLSAYLRKRKK